MAVTILTAVPDADVSNAGSWTTTDLYAKVDESPFSDSDFISSPSAPSNAACVLGLSNIADLGVSTGHRLRIRYRKGAAGSHRMDLAYRLLQNTTEIAAWTDQDIGSSFTTIERVLSGTQADSITDYNDLRVELSANKVSSTPSVPTFVAAGAAAGGTGAVTPGIPAGTLANDILLLFVESANETISLTTANGFVQVTDSPQGTGTAAGTTAVRLAVYWKRATGSDSDPVVADAGNHTYAVILGFRGCKTSGDPWSGTPDGDTGASSTSVTVPGVTTAAANCLVVAAVAWATDIATAQSSGWTNGNLSDINERFDAGTTQGNGGGVSVATGTKASAGATGNTTATLAGASVQARHCLALEPAALVDTTCDVSGVQLIERNGPNPEDWDGWYESDSLAGLSDSDPVASWDDEGPDDNDLVQATSGNRPIYKVNQTPSGLGCIRTDGADDFLDSELTMPTGNAPVVICAVIKMAVGDFDNQSLISWGNRDTNEMVAFESNGAGEAANFSGYGNDIGDADALTPGDWQIISCVWDQTERYIRVDGVEVATGGFAGKATASSALRVGRPLNDGDGPFPGRFDLAALLVASFVATEDDIEEAESYLLNKYLVEGALELNLSGAITPTGAVAKLFIKQLSGAIAPAGSLSKSGSKQAAGTITPSGAALRTGQKALAGATAPTGAIAKTGQKASSGSITPTGVVARTAQKLLVGVIAPAGSLQRLVSKLITGSITPSGAIATLRAIVISLSGSITPTGAIVRTAQKGLGGVLSSAGAIAKTTIRTVAGSITPSGAIEVIRAIFLSLAGSITPTGSIVRSTQKALGGTLTSAGSVVKNIARMLAGAITPTGAINLISSAGLYLSGGIAPVGTLAKSTARTLAGAIAPGGSLQKLAQKVAGGSISPTGALALIKVFIRLLGGAIAPTGAIVKNVTKTSAGAIAPVGALAKLTARTVAGAIAPGGSLRKFADKLLGGSISPTGALALIKTFIRFLGGSIAPTGAILKTATKTTAGAISPAGALLRLTQKVFSASISPTGALSTLKIRLLLLGGSIAPTGAISRAVSKGLSGAIAPTGALRKLVSKILAGAISPIATLLKISGIQPAAKVVVDVQDFAKAVVELEDLPVDPPEE